MFERNIPGHKLLDPRVLRIARVPEVPPIPGEQRVGLPRCLSPIVPAMTAYRAAS